MFYTDFRSLGNGEEETKLNANILSVGIFGRVGDFEFLRSLPNRPG